MLPLFTYIHNTNNNSELSTLAPLTLATSSVLLSDFVALSAFSVLFLSVFFDSFSSVFFFSSPFSLSSFFFSSVGFSVVSSFFFSSSAGICYTCTTEFTNTVKIYSFQITDILTRYQFFSIIHVSNTLELI
jgi:hypothetical protein